MAKPRLEMLEDFVRKDPRDAFSRYALAMEYVNAQRYDEAIAHFRALIAQDPDYIATYFQLGQACERTGRPEEARAAYEQGIAACRRKGDSKTLGELEFALEQLSGSTF